jgi:chromosomal replication initiator protein
VICSPIQSAVCSHFGIELPELLSKDRHKSLAFARQLAMYLCRTILQLSYPELGRAFGRDHTTCLAACRKMARVCAEDAVAAAHLAAIVKALGAAEVRQQCPAPDYAIREVA